MAIFTPTDKNIKEAASIIKAGGIVSFPTETVYGLGADAMNPIAVARIFEAKNRPFFDPLIAHLSDPEQIFKITKNVDDEILKLAEEFWPGPLTIVLPKSENVPDIVTSGLDTVACRVPDHPVAIKLIEMCGTPIAAPSANPFGFLSPTQAIHVEDQLGSRVDMILDGGKCKIGVESTIIKIENHSIELLRPGGIPVELIESITGKPVTGKKIFNNPESPGQLDYHYSPSKPVKISNNIDFNDNNACFLLFKDPGIDYPDEKVEILSQSGDIKEAAANLFSALHRLDKLKYRVIIAEPVPKTGLGLAIMDRLVKASNK